MRNATRLLVPFVSLFGAAACNVSTTGDRGIVDFTPEDCGQYVCTLDASIAAGASVNVVLSGTSDAAGLTLVSDDPQIAVVFPLAFDRWQVTAIRTGFARLTVLDGGYDLDGTTISIVRPDRYGLVVDDGPAFQKAPDYPDEEIWSVPAGETLAFRVRPYNVNGEELMGRLNLETELDAALFDRLSPSSNLPEGELVFNPMFVGDYGMSVNAKGVGLDIFFEAR